MYDLYLRYRRNNYVQLALGILNILFIICYYLKMGAMDFLVMIIATCLLISGMLSIIVSVRSNEHKEFKQFAEKTILPDAQSWIFIMRSLRENISLNFFSLVAITAGTLLSIVALLQEMDRGTVVLVFIINSYCLIRFSFVATKLLMQIRNAGYAGE